MGRSLRLYADCRRCVVTFRVVMTPVLRSIPLDWTYKKAGAVRLEGTCRRIWGS